MHKTIFYTASLVNNLLSDDVNDVSAVIQIAKHVHHLLKNSARSQIQHRLHRKNINLHESKSK